MTEAKERTEPLDPARLLADLAAWWANPEREKFSGRIPSRIAGSDWDQTIPEGVENPYWQIIRQLPLDPNPLPWRHGIEPVTHVITETGLRYFSDRWQLCPYFAWSIPSPGDMAWMRDILGGRGVVEIGAGTGYWAWQMQQAGIDVVAYEPNEPGAENKFARRAWTTVLPGWPDEAAHHPDRALFLCWPSYSEPWAAQALACYRGDLLIYAGEGEGGCCADDDFFRLRDAEWEEIGGSPAHISFWGIHCYLTAYRRTAVSSGKRAMT